VDRARVVRSVAIWRIADGPRACARGEGVVDPAGGGGQERREFATENLACVQ
jgi:hypothetical protein